MGNPLGDRLREVRTILGLSLRSVAEPAKISVAYLQKLEGGDVQQPSPNILYRLSGVLDISYASLMELAGYVIPSSEPASAGTTFDHALSSSDLSEEERRAVAAYIRILRDQRD